MLEPLGLTPTEERVYDAMVMSQTATLAELAGQTGMSRAGIARAVQMLAAKGMITRLPGHAVRYSALDPAIAVSALTQLQQQALHAARDHMLELARLYASGHNRTHPAEQVEVIDGHDNVWKTVTRLEYATTRQIRIFDAPPYLEPHPELENADERVILGKGVTVRCVYAREGVFIPGRETHIRAAINRGEQARIAAALPMKMMICDSQMALIPLMPAAADGLAAGYLIHPSSLLDALAALFEAYWNQSVPLNLAAVAAEAGPDAQDQSAVISDADHRILALLAAGATDDAIGRATGCSMRTVQRRIRDLMQVVGAQTRFQLGMAATHRNWV